MSDQSVEEIMKEEEIMQRMETVEEKAKDEIVKYFDRIHDKLFAYNLFFLAGYISLIAIPSIRVSVWWLIILVFCVLRLIYVDWKMMEQSRKLSSVTNMNLKQIQQLNHKQQQINIHSLEIVVESLVTTVGFFCMLI